MARAADAPVYDESVDAPAQVTQALAHAKADNKPLMIVFGANWCGDCKMLDGEFKKPALKSLLDANYVIVKVDVNRFNKNLDVVKPYGEVIKRGIPSIVIVTPANQLADSSPKCNVTVGRGCPLYDDPPTLLNSQEQL